MIVLGGIFLIAHGLVHLAIWLPPAKDDAPFDPGRSWLLGEARPLARPLAVLVCAVLVLAGLLVLIGAGVAAGAAVVGATISLALVALTFNPWLSAAVAINVAIAVVALA